MPRRAREISTTDVYHIIFKGNDKQNLFYDKKDKYIFLKILKENKEKFNYEIYSYCLMSNHIHIVIRIKEKFLSKAMKSLGVRYSLYFNKKLNRTGHVFENRFFSRRVEKLGYFLKVCKYVHRNPEKAKIEKTDLYNWSSYLDYIKKNEEIVKISTLLSYFDNDINKFKEYTLMNDDLRYLNKVSEFEMINKLDEEELGNIIKEKFNLKFASDVSLLNSKEKSDVIKYLLSVSGTNINQISRVTKVTRYYIEKISD